MSDDQRAFLDELFGKERNIASNKRKNDVHYWNDNVCKYALISLCFNELWKHTKYDSGECSKLNFATISPKIGQSGRKNILMMQLVDEFHFYQHLAYILNKTKEVDKIALRHEEQLDEHAKSSIERPFDIQQRIDNMEIQMKKLLVDSEKLGEMGKFEESERLVQEQENLKKARDDVILVWEAQSNPFKTYKICELCGAKMSLHETENRVRQSCSQLSFFTTLLQNRMHIDGKIHQGFQIVRSEFEKLSRRKEEIERQLELANEQEEKLPILLTNGHDKERRKNSEELSSKEKHNQEKDKVSKKKKKSRSRSRDKTSKERRNKQEQRQSRKIQIQQGQGLEKETFQKQRVIHYFNFTVFQRKDEQRLLKRYKKKYIQLQIY